MGKLSLCVTLTMIVSQEAHEPMTETVCCLLQYLFHSFPLVLAPQFLAGHTATQNKRLHFPASLACKWWWFYSVHWDLSGSAVWYFKNFHWRIYPYFPLFSSHMDVLALSYRSMAWKPHERMAEGKHSV